MIYENHQPHTEQMERKREHHRHRHPWLSPFLSQTNRTRWRCKTILNHFYCVTETTKRWKYSQSWGVTLTWGRLPLQGIKTLWELPSATLQLKQATKQHPAQFKLLRWLPPSRALSFTHSGASVFPSSSLLLFHRNWAKDWAAFSCRLPQRSEPPYDCAALREEAGNRLPTVKRGERKWAKENGSRWKK